MEEELQHYEEEINSLNMPRPDSSINGHENTPNMMIVAGHHKSHQGDRKQDQKNLNALNSQLQHIAMMIEESGSTVARRNSSAGSETRPNTAMSSATHRSALSGVVFLRRKTEARLHQPSQTYYTIKLSERGLGPINTARIHDAEADAFEPTDIFSASTRKLHHVLDSDPATRILNQSRPSSSQSVSPSRSRASTTPLGWTGSRPGTADTLELSRRSTADPAGGSGRAQHKVDLVERKQIKEDLKRHEFQEAQRVDALIKGWLRDRQRKGLQRQKRVRDTIRMDRKFVANLGAKPMVDGIDANGR
jgi:hypothetical protein